MDKEEERGILEVRPSSLVSIYRTSTFILKPCLAPKSPPWAHPQAYPCRDVGNDEPHDSVVFNAAPRGVCRKSICGYGALYDGDAASTFTRGVYDPYMT
ncbi:hypothetical protein MRX96_059642 [Rhipicephalus microplus]